jgi:protein-tyrosine phosphatase
MSSSGPAPNFVERMAARLRAVPGLGGVLRGARPKGRSRPSYYHVDRVAPWLLVGPALRSQDYERLSPEGVTHVLDLREEAADDSRALDRLGIAYRRLPVPNEGVPSDEQFDEVSRWLEDEVLAERGVLYVHCQGGLGRAPTCSMALLITLGYALGEAYRLVRAARPEASPSEVQMLWLEDLERRSRQVTAAQFPDRETR